MINDYRGSYSSLQQAGGVFDWKLKIAKRYKFYMKIFIS